MRWNYNSSQNLSYNSTNNIVNIWLRHNNFNIRWNIAIFYYFKVSYFILRWVCLVRVVIAFSFVSYVSFVTCFSTESLFRGKFFQGDTRRSISEIEWPVKNVRSNTLEKPNVHFAKYSLNTDRQQTIQVTQMQKRCTISLHNARSFQTCFLSPWKYFP